MQLQAGSPAGRPLGAGRLCSQPTALDRPQPILAGQPARPGDMCVCGVGPAMGPMSPDPHWTVHLRLATFSLFPG